MLHKNKKGIFVKWRSQVRVKCNINMMFGLALLVAFVGAFPLASGATDFKALVQQLEKLNVEMNAVRRELVETRTALYKSMVGEASTIYQPSNFNPN